MNLENLKYIHVHKFNTEQNMAQIIKYLKKYKVKISKASNRPWRPTGLRDVEDPTFSRQSAHRWW
jgi:hypothetical protein